MWNQGEYIKINDKAQNLLSFLKHCCSTPLLEVFL